jgi:2-phospho-L-lactate transferase/gluconeogenesis factor (CofD/UPF0052 family)
LKVYVCNLMSQANESLGLTASEHIKAICDHAKRQIFDAALLNIRPLSPELKAKYAMEGSSQIVVDADAVQRLGVTPVVGDFLIEDKGVARHATDRVATQLMTLTTSRNLINAV